VPGLPENQELTMLEWLQNPYIAIAVAVGAMFFGYFFGLFEGRGQGYKRRQAEEAEKNELEIKAEPLPPASPALPPDEIPVLDVSRDSAGQLRLKLDGQRIEAAVMNPEQRKRMIAILTQIRPWLEPATPTPPPAQPRPVSSPKEAPPAETMPAAPASPPSRLAPAPSADDRPTAPPPAGDEKEPVPAPQSIVTQVDTILQAQLAGTPLMEKGVRLQESPEGGVIVWVGMSKYEGIDGVPDDQIKAAIRTAITTWENKYTPGL
jgi:hypothetical protein